MAFYKEAYEKLQTQYSVYGSEGDQYRTTFYDTATLATSTNSYTLFNSAVGLNSVTKAQTNMESPGAFAKNTNFFVERIGLRLGAPSSNSPTASTSSVLNAFTTVCGSSTIVLNMSGKQNVGEWPLIAFLNSVNLSILPAAAGDAVISTNISMASVWYNVGNFNDQTAIPLLEQDTFSFIITQWDTTTTVPAALNNFRLKVELEGVIQRRK